MRSSFGAEDRRPSGPGSLSRLPTATQHRIAEARARWQEETAAAPASPPRTSADDLPSGPGLVEVIDRLRAVAVRVVAAMVVAGLLGYLAGTLVEPRFEADAVLHVLDDRVRTGVLGEALPPAGASAAEVAGLVDSAEVRSRAGIDDPDSDVTVSSASAEDGTVSVSVSAPTADEAVAAATQVVQASIDVQQGRIADSLAALVTELGERAAELRVEADAVVAELADLGARIAAATTAGPAGAVEVAALTAEANALQLRRDALIDEERDVARRASELDIEARLGDGALRLVVPVGAASEATMPKSTHLAILGAGVALLLAIGFVYVRAALESARRDR